MALETTDAAWLGAAAVAPERPRPSRTLRAIQGTGPAVADRQAVRDGIPGEAGRTPVDLEELTRRFRGRREIVLKILSLFGDECGRLVGELRLLIDRADLAGATAVAHRLKGAAGTASAHAVAGAAGRIEEGCRRGRPEEVIAGFADLEREARRAADQIAGELARHEAGPAGNEAIERS